MRTLAILAFSFAVGTLAAALEAEGRLVASCRGGAAGTGGCGVLPA